MRAGRGRERQNVPRIMRGFEWHIVVLDESQAIKNPEAKWSRAVRQLNARHHLCLSGIPVENNLSEIWSRFAFLMKRVRFAADSPLEQKRFEILVPPCT
jgi:SNF2 family DNA or RNA helicase